MNALSAKDAKDWCELSQVFFPEKLSWDGRFRPIAPKEKLPIRFSIRKDAGARINDCRSLFAPLRGQNILVWYDDWGVWPSGEFKPMFDRFRCGFGISTTLAETPAHLFGSTEYDDALSSFIFAALFLWDCHVVTKESGYAIFLSHDEYGYAKFPTGNFE